MYEYNKGLYWKSVHIANDGYVCADQSCPQLSSQERVAFRQATSTKLWAKTEGDKIAQSLLEDFHASYVVTSKDYRTFGYILSNNPHFKLELYDEQSGFLLFSVHKI